MTTTARTLALLAGAALATSGGTAIAATTHATTHAPTTRDLIQTGRVSIDAPQRFHVTRQVYSKHATYEPFAHPVAGGYKTAGFICAGDGAAPSARCDFELDDERVWSNPTPDYTPDSIQGFTHNTGVVCQTDKGDTVKRTATTAVFGGQKATVVRFDVHCTGISGTYTLWHFAAERVDILASGESESARVAAAMPTIHFTTR